jgi:hypothetical protein
MKKGLIIIFASCLLTLPLYLAQAAERDPDAVLTSAEGLFKAMQRKDYAGIWTCLSGESRSTIVGDTRTAMKSASYTEESVSDDFARGGVLSRAYWDAYLENFDPVLVLEESKWEVGSFRDDRAEITITYRKAQKPSTLYMVREEGTWRVGLTESFWSRK